MVIRPDVRADRKPRKRETGLPLAVSAHEAPRRRFDRLRAFQVERDAGADGADLARPRVAARSDRDRETDPRRRLRRALRRGRVFRRHRGDAVRGQDLLRLRLAQPVPAFGENTTHDVPSAPGVALKQLGHRRRRLHQHVLIAAIADELHQRLDCLARTLVQGNTPIGKHAARLVAGALFQPDRGDGFALAGEPLGHGARRRQRVADRGRRVDRDDRVDAGIGEERTERIPVTRGGRIGEQVDRIAAAPGRRQGAVELGERRLAELGEPPALAQHHVARHLGDAAAVGDDRDAIAADADAGADGAGRRDQVGEARHREHAGAAEGGVVDLRTARSPRVGDGCAAGAIQTTRVEDDDRLEPRRGAGGGDELAGTSDVIDAQQHRPRVGVHRQVVEHVGEIDVRPVAERGQQREADAARGGPVEHPGHQRAGLTDEGEIAVLHRRVRVARVRGRSPAPSPRGRPVR